MVLAKSKNKAGLGNSLMNDRFGKGKGSDMRKGNFQPQAIQRTGATGETYITNPKQEASWVKMRSVTEQGALDDFLSTAELAGTDFTAEKMNNVKIIHRDQKNPFLLNSSEEAAVRRKHRANRERLTVPRRPAWDEKTTPQQLDEMERLSLLEWRRGLAELQESNDLLMTPFERNLEVWRQLWRVIERSDLVVQIVDARNPLMFRSEDLESYVKEVDKRKKNLLLVNKADMMTLEQRQLWADYFDKEGIAFRFFSAALAKEENEARDLAERKSDDSESSDEDEDDEDDGEGQEEADEVTSDIKQTPHPTKADMVEESTDGSEGEVEEQDDDVEDSGDDKVDRPHKSTRPIPANWSHERTRILSTDELESLFLEHAPKPSPNTTSTDSQSAALRKTQIGLVGYPNVGKSSTINALMGAKKVSVSATPGKTKHFQTLHLSDQIVLCDCPGLVFPNFAFTKAELVCNGVLPIDQLREYTGPAGLVAQRIPQPFLEAIYGMKMQMRPLEEGGTGIPTSEELLRAYATARGFSTQGLGQPDESRAARFILKDYVKGRLLFCHPPPADPPIDSKHFNRDLYDLAHLPEKRRAALAAALASELDGGEEGANPHDDDNDAASLSLSALGTALPQGSKTQHLDKRFFVGVATGDAGHLAQPFHYKYSVQGKQLTEKKARLLQALEAGVDPSEVGKGGKRHAEKRMRRRGKVRATYE